MLPFFLCKKLLNYASFLLTVTKHDDRMIVQLLYTVHFYRIQGGIECSINKTERPPHG
ncbi:hypothetical protein [Bacillus phage vB_BceM_Bc431v3]|uniref:Uncharacterized protein n=1 Tax=Bacillus phage vB_BceM_Bc431v3 TaxID=1195072 RepID=M4HNK1_9CAUD|nr:hypothetical protein K201_gp161 [Bacillus phage vB_BceM_Bc431v3]AFQ96469.1 hypothetical protein [Bacillus phage vB_BceM_Bc431v3]